MADWTQTVSPDPGSRVPGHRRIGESLAWGGRRGRSRPGHPHAAVAPHPDREARGGVPSRPGAGSALASSRPTLAWEGAGVQGRRQGSSHACRGELAEVERRTGAPREARP